MSTTVEKVTPRDPNVLPVVVDRAWDLNTLTFPPPASKRTQLKENIFSNSTA